MNQIKSIISIGQGRLHLFETASALKKVDIDVRVITGWVPPNFIPDRLLDLLGKIVNRRKLSYGLRKRTFEGPLLKCGFSEFVFNFFNILVKVGIFRRQWAESLGWGLYGLQSRKYIKESDIFHVRSGAGNCGAIRKAKAAGMKVIVDQSAAHPDEITAQLLKAYKGDKIPFDPHTGTWKYVIEDCKNADYILVISDYIKNSFIVNGFDSRYIFVIPLGIKEEFYNLKSSYKLESTVKLIYTGGVTIWKGALLMIEMINKLIERDIAFEIDVIGSISEEISIPMDLLQNKKVRFHGYKTHKEMIEYLKKADIYIYPSYCDGGAQSQREAMAAGLPVISNSKTGSQIIHAENGWLIPDDSSEALTEAVIKLSNDETLREKIGRNAAATIQNNYTWKQYGENVLKLYTKILYAQD